MDRGVGKSQGLFKFTIREVNLCVLSCKERRGPHVHPPLFKKKGSRRGAVSLEKAIFQKMLRCKERQCFRGGDSIIFHTQRRREEAEWLGGVDRREAVVKKSRL